MNFMNAKTLKLRLIGTAKKYEGFECECFDMVELEDLNDLNGTKLELFVREVNEIMKRERSNYKFVLSNLDLINDGRAVSVTFLIAWLEPDNEIMLTTLNIESL